MAEQIEQRWLTIDAVSSTLRLPLPYIRTLTKQGFLVSMGTGDNRRYLDPTPEYAEKLRLAAILHSNAMFVPPDINELFLLTLREVCVLLGWKLNYGRLYMKRNPDIPRFRVNSQLHLFSVKTVRELLWKRQGRRLSKQRSPFLILELVDYVQRQHDEETRDMPTDAQHAADEAVMRKLESIVRRSEKDQVLAKADFARKVDLAGKVVQILDSVRPSDPRQAT